MNKILKYVAAGLLVFGSACASLAAPITNLPPIANPGGPYLLYLGESLQLDGSGSTDPDLPLDSLSYAWDLDHDGMFDDLVGATPTASWALLFTALHPQAGMSYVIGLRVTDSFGASDAAETTLVALERTGSSVPEPSSLALALLGVGLAGGLARRVAHGDRRDR